MADGVTLAAELSISGRAKEVSTRTEVVADGVRCLQDVMPRADLKTMWEVISTRLAKSSVGGPRAMPYETHALLQGVRYKSCPEVI